MATVPPQPPVPPAPPAPQPAKKKTSPFVWIAAGCGGLLIAALLALMAGGVFVAKKVKEARAHPGLAVAKLIAAANPDVEVVSTDEADGTITLRNKKTGEEVTMNLADVKKGKIEFRNPKGESVSVSAKGGKSGGFEVHSDKGSFTAGAGAGKDIPAWVPEYAGGEPQGAWSTHNEEGLSGAFSFTTPDGPGTVMGFYETTLHRDGFKVDRTTSSRDGALTGGVITGTAGPEGRSIVVTLSSDDGSTSVMVHYEVKAGGSATDH